MIANYHTGQYAPLSDIAFAPFHPVMPTELPPTSAVFPFAWANKMLNIPNQNLYTLYGSPGQYAANQQSQR